MCCPPSLWMNQGFQVPSQGYNLLSRPKAAQVDTDHNPQLCHVSSHELTERGWAWPTLRASVHRSGNTWITYSQLPSLATHLSATSTAWKHKETNTGEVVHGQELLISLNEGKLITSFECLSKVSTIWWCETVRSHCRHSRSSKTPRGRLATARNFGLAAIW